MPYLRKDYNPDHYLYLQRELAAKVGVFDVDNDFAELEAKREFLRSLGISKVKMGNKWIGLGDQRILGQHLTRAVRDVKREVEDYVKKYAPRHAADESSKGAERGYIGSQLEFKFERVIDLSQSMQDFGPTRGDIQRLHKGRRK